MSTILITEEFLQSIGAVSSKYPLPTKGVTSTYVLSTFLYLRFRKKGKSKTSICEAVRADMSTNWQPISTLNDLFNLIFLYGQSKGIETGRQNLKDEISGVLGLKELVSQISDEVRYRLDSNRSSSDQYD